MKSDIPAIKKVREYDYSHLPPYEPVPGAPEVALVDLDGTLCLRRPGGRGPYDESTVIEDLVNVPVMRAVCALAAAGIPPVFMSGRKESCRDGTEEWLRRHCPFPGVGLFMRADGDTRVDWEIKYDLFTEHVRDRYRVVMVIDDRGQVVKMWRAIGLTVFDVAGNNV